MVPHQAQVLQGSLPHWGQAPREQVRVVQVALCNGDNVPLITHCFCPCYTAPRICLSTMRLASQPQTAAKVATNCAAGASASCRRMSRSRRSIVGVLTKKTSKRERRRSRGVLTPAAFVSQVHLHHHADARIAASNTATQARRPWAGSRGPQMRTG